jgi:hypothetical protein
MLSVDSADESCHHHNAQCGEPQNKTFEIRGHRI